MVKLHRHVGTLALLFVLVIGVAECRRLGEDEIVDGNRGGGGIGGGF
uniref:Uncharacterized protein n=1 Tax=Lotus japonicus TaxID=34305 RepID=I3SFA6_LOTJA|nr:unknown [Lotus japonicus]